MIAALSHGGCSVFFSSWGIPPLTMGFCIAGSIFVLLQGNLQIGMNDAVEVEDSNKGRRFFHLVVDNDNILYDPTRRLVQPPLRSPSLFDLRALTRNNSLDGELVDTIIDP